MMCLFLKPGLKILIVNHNFKQTIKKSHHFETTILPYRQLKSDVLSFHSFIIITINKDDQTYK